MTQDDRLPDNASPIQYTGKTLNEAITAKFGQPPPALRAFATTVAGDRTPITEKFFEPKELDILRSAAEKALSLRVTKPWRIENRHLKDNEAVMGYGDYGEKDPFSEGTKSVVDALTDLPHSLSFTLGMAKVRRESDGTLVITDKYQGDARKSTVDGIRKEGTFSVLRKAVEAAIQNGLLGVGNFALNLALPEGSEDARRVEIRIPPK